MTAPAASILVVEDDAKTSASLRRGLDSAGYRTRIARSAEEALELLDEESWDLVVLDWMLPGRDGLDVLRCLRGRGRRMPVLLVTARDAVDDRVQGLDAGADDYLVKPFAFAELLARVRALVRRSVPEPALQPAFADLRVDMATRRVWRGGREIELTPREYDILTFLLRHARQVVTRAMLAREVWRETRRATPLDNAIDVHIGHLRRKIDGPGEARLIHTVRGVGFVLQEGEPA